jgi:putative ABC transport system substrate-binding protein
MRALVLATACLAAPGTQAQAQATPARTWTVAISTIIEAPPLLQARDGVRQALAERGFVEGRNLVIKYQQAGGNGATQREIAQRFASEGADAIVALSTPTAQAMQAASREIPIVFAAVTDPVKAGLISSFGKTGTNITGVSDIAPLALQLQLFRDLVPGLKRIGYLYNPQLPSPVSTLQGLRRTSEPLGLEVVESPVSSGDDVAPAAARLLGKVDAIYVPNDTTINPVLEAVIKVGRDARLPIFTGENSGVARGALASVALDYTEIGRLAGQMVADVLSGRAVGDIDAVVAHQKLGHFIVAVNKRAALAMGVELPPAVLKRASQLIE